MTNFAENCATKKSDAKTQQSLLTASWSDDEGGEVTLALMALEDDDEEVEVEDDGQFDDLLSQHCKQALEGTKVALKKIKVLEKELISVKADRDQAVKALEVK